MGRPTRKKSKPKAAAAGSRPKRKTAPKPQPAAAAPQAKPPKKPAAAVAAPPPGDDPPPKRTTREAQADLMARKRKGERDLELPLVANPERREACEADPDLWLKTYCYAGARPMFAFDFTGDQKGIREDALNCIRYGGDQADAAPRGDGKTSIAQGCMCYAIVKGWLPFGAVVGANKQLGQAILANIKAIFETSQPLLDDYPEICIPIRALEGAPARGNMQTVAGERTKIKWGASVVVFPAVVGSAASGAIVMARGMNAAVRGLLWEGKRPTFVLVDDPETRDSARNPLQIEIRRQRIVEDIGGLAGQGQTLGCLVLCTLQTSYCLAAQLTDPDRFPSFNGRRIRQVIDWPERADLWEDNMALRRAGKQNKTDRHGRAAQQHYLDNRAEMDRGHKCSNPNRFNGRLLADGTPAEISAIQSVYNQICDKGLNFVLTEIQNDPPESETDGDSEITETLIRSRLNNFPKGIITNDALYLTAFCDIGEHRCYWAVVAWLQFATGLVIDYDFEDVGSHAGSVDEAITKTLLYWRGKLLATPYKLENGQTKPFDLILIDSQYKDLAVYNFLHRIGGKPFQASKGFGSGPNQTAFKIPAGRKGSTKHVGDHWFENPLPKKKVVYVGMDADYWKGVVHDRFKTETFNPDLSLARGSLSLFGSEARVHNEMARHLTGETLQDRFTLGKGNKRVWHRTRAQHWFDCLYGNCVAADKLGCKLFPEDEPEPMAALASRRMVRFHAQQKAKVTP